jgi:hypothetical protein
MESKGSFKKPEQQQPTDGAAESTNQKLLNDVRDFTSKAANVADSAGFEKVSNFLRSVIGPDGSWNLDNVTQKDIKDVMALNSKQIDDATKHQKKVSVALDTAALNLKQFG